MNLLNKIEKPLFVVNLQANEKRSLDKWRQVEYYLDYYNVRYDVKFTTNREEAVNLVRKDKKHRMIIVVGGDGGVNALVEGAIKNDLEKILGTIPAGIANDIAKTFDIYSNPNKFYRTLLNKNIMEIDVGEVNGKYFLGHASLGFDALTLNERNKRHFLKGKLSYFAGALRALFKYTSKKMKIKFGGEEEIDKTIFLMVVSNIKYYADGMKIAPLAEPNDGLLDLCLIEGESNLGVLLNNLSRVYSGAHINNSKVYYHQSGQLEIFSPEPVFLQIDGDLIGEDTYFKFNLANKKIKMLV